MEHAWMSARPWRRLLETPATWVPLLGLSLLLVASATLFMGLGPVHVSPAQTLAILLRRIGVGLAVPCTPQEAAVILTLRLPRAVRAICAGAGLSLAGATLQGVLRNPVVDPGLLGAAGGAGLAAACLLCFEHVLPWHPAGLAGSLLL